ncbi:MAG: hypothetical protein WC365_09530 [Candidatus Babeliales bacterium]|jgi:hypothetical protein
MSSTSGISWFVGTYSGDVFSNLGGIPYDVHVTRKSTTTKEPGTGQRRLASIDTSGVHYVIDFKLKIITLADFISGKCFVTAEGTLPSLSLYVTDGITERGFTTAYVNTCSVDITHPGAIVANVQVIAIAGEDKAAVTGAADTGTVMTKSALTTLSLGGTTITKWIKVTFGVNNNVQVLSTGTGAVCTEIWAGHAEYSGSITLVKTAELSYGYSTVVTKDLIITLTDNQGSPVATTFTFDDVRASSNEHYVQELGLTYEGVTWEGDELAIT